MISTAATLYLAKAPLLQADGKSIQMFPPGVHSIVPSNSDPAKKAVAVELTIDEATATLLESVRAEYQAKADSGEEDAPYFDFNHEDGSASFWPKRIFWGGDDALLGGVRAEGERSSDGDAAIEGKNFRRFSPAFYAAKGRITGAPVNMGGLVNRAAFRKIQALFAKQADAPAADPDPTIETKPTMLTEEEIKALQEEKAALETKVAEMQTQLDDLTTAAKAATEKEAEAAVAMAAKEGRIGTSVELHAKWKASIIANPDAKELLMGLPVNAALAADLIKAKAADPTKPDPDAEEKPKEGLTGLAEIIKAKRHAKAD